jgi:integrase
MPRPRPLYVEMQITRHGRKVWYFRRSRDERRIRLPDVYGSQEFTDAYQVCLAGGVVQPAGKRGASRGKLAWLIELYMKSGKWESYRPATRKARGHILQKLAEEKGAVDVEDIDRAAIVAAVEKRRGTPEQANVILTALKQMFAWGVEAGHVDRNPAEGVKGVKKPKAGPDEEEGHKTWTEEDLARFKAYWPHGTPERLLFSVLCYTGLRIGDAARFGVQHVQRDGTIKLRNEKTGALVQLPILQSLREAIVRGPERPTGQLGFVVWRRGVNVGKEHLGAEFSAACKEASLEDCTAHGLRKAAAVKLAEAGKSVDELMSIFGWARPDMAIKYTRMASKKKLAMNAMGALEEGEIKNVYSLTDILGEGTEAKGEIFSIAS